MITLRHHALTIVAVFLALAAGIVLGGGPLSDVGPTVATSAKDDVAAPAGDSAQADFTEDFVSTLAPPILSGRLDDRAVAVLTLPGADEQVVTALASEVDAAGGTISGRYSLAADLADPDQKSLVDTLGSQLLTQQAEGDVAADASTYDRIGQLLGLAVASKDANGTEPTGRTRAIADAIAGSGLMEGPDKVGTRAPLVLLVLGDDADDEGADAILGGLAQGLSAQAVGVVVVGTTDDGAGQLGRLRGAPAGASVSSVDGIDTLAGRVSAVIALQKVLGGQRGSFGASGSDGAVPLG